MVSKLAIFWFFTASILVLWDAFFVLLRPRSMPGGDLHFFWKPYELYVWVDKRYGDMEDTFGLAQTWLNLIEVCFNFVTLTLLLQKNKGALLTGFFVSSLTFWKTSIYMLQYTALCRGSHLLSHLDWNQFIFLFLIPNGVWIVVPLMLILSFGAQLHAILSPKDKRKSN